jgi:hypothetical protein
MITVRVTQVTGCSMSCEDRAASQVRAMQREVSTEPPATAAAAAASLTLKQVAELGTATASQLYLNQKVFQLHKRKLALATQTAQDTQSRCAPAPPPTALPLCEVNSSE